MPPHPREGRGVEEIGVVDKAPDEPLRPIVRLEDQIEPRRPCLQIERGEVPPRVAGRPRGPEGKKDLKQRVAARIPQGVQFPHEVVERHRVVGQRLQGHIPHPAQELPERGVAGQVGAQDHGVEEIPDQPLELGVVAGRGGAADDDVVLPRIAVQQRLERREQGHVQGHPFSPAQRLELIGQALGQREWFHRATERLHGRSWTVGRQLEHGEASGKLLLPVRHVLRKNGRLEPRRDRDRPR